MADTITKDTIVAALGGVKGPDLSGNIVDLGLLSEIVIHGNKVYFAIKIDPSRADELEPMRQAAEKVVSELPGVESVAITLTADREQSSAPNGNGQKTPSPAPAAQPSPPPSKPSGISKVKSIIAVASGKGGVGKSTTAVNLALALQANGLKIGLLDADIYGPSIPRLLGLVGQPQQSEGNILKPMQGYGLNTMSMGFLVEEDSAMIWRGPMVMSAISQMLKDVAWGELDILVVDMPPGTGDAQLTLAQQVPLAGAVIVSTPQDLALIDARKGLNMFRKVDVPVLGIIENMSYFECPSCGERSDIFGHGGAKAEAEKIGVPFLGEIPLHMDIREKSDAGQPVVVSAPDSSHAKIYRSIATNVLAEIDRNKSGAQPQAPNIVIES